MYKRIIAVVVAVILLLTVGLTVVYMTSMFNRERDSRLNALKEDARELATLFEKSCAATEGVDAVALQQMYAKAATIYEEHNAYLVISDFGDNTLTNYSVFSTSDPELAEALTKHSNLVAHKQMAVYEGREVVERMKIGDLPVFMVAIPYHMQQTNIGVMIVTRVQHIESGIGDMVMPIAVLAVLVMLLAVAVISLLIDSAIRPLRVLTKASADMADGNFNVEVPKTPNAPPEIRELTRAFNTMAAKLKITELSRREFVANVSHELRSPITSIAGFVQGMEDGTIPPEEHAHYLAIVGDETRRLNKLITSLLVLSRLERDDAALEYHNFDICEMLRRAIIRRVPELESKKLEIECDFVIEPCMVSADSDRIEQVVINLVDNAIKFTPEGGTITLRTWREGDRCFVRVKDTGIGILPEDRPRVFERFFTVDRAHTSGKGTGLGLSICQRIMEMHGQSIVLEDTPPGEGASFVFTLARANG